MGQAIRKGRARGGSLQSRWLCPDAKGGNLKAVVFSGHGSVEFTDVELADPGPGEVKVKIAAAGVCHSDLHVRRGEWAVPRPLVMGHEGSGVVIAVGEGTSHVAVGDHVILSWVPAC